MTTSDDGHIGSGEQICITYDELLALIVASAARFSPLERVAYNHGWRVVRRRVTDLGIQIDGHWYRIREDSNGMPQPKRHFVRCIYNPRDRRHIYIQQPDKQRYRQVAEEHRQVDSRTSNQDRFAGREPLRAIKPDALMPVTMTEGVPPVLNAAIPVVVVSMPDATSIHDLISAVWNMLDAELCSRDEAPQDMSDVL